MGGIIVGEAKERVYCLFLGVGHRHRPSLPSEKGGEEVVRGVGVRALAEEIAQSGDELPPRADDVEPARDEADQLFAQSHQAVAVCRLAGRLKQAPAAHCAGTCGRRASRARAAGLQGT
eukprot:scaffold2806_cov135-Isochrysis_galbana.AAC.6